jgi:hypothetical protein
MDQDKNEEYNNDYDIDIPVATLQANVHDSKTKKKILPKSSPQCPRMSRDKWFSLSEAQRLIWDQLDDKAKAIILGISKPQPSQRQVNLHEISVFDFLQANAHQLEQIPELDSELNDEDTEEFQNAQQDSEPDTLTDSVLVHAAKSKSNKLQPGDICRVMSKTSKQSVNLTHVVYSVSAHKSSNPHSLVDCGANGGVAGDDVRVIFCTECTVDISGIDNHQVTNIDIGTVGGVVMTQKGFVIAIFHQYALLGKGHSIHSPCPLEWYHNDVNGKSIHINGLQCIKTLDGYVIPHAIKDGLARLDICPYMDKEWDNLPHVFLTAENRWDPSVLDHDFQGDEQWFDAISDLETDPYTILFDQFGNYHHRVIVQESHVSPNNDEFLDAHATDVEDHNVDIPVGDPDDPPDDTTTPKLKPHIVTSKTPDYAALHPLFGWLSTDIIQKTFEKTTQYARIPTGTMLKQTFHSPYPALNVHCHNESVACDIVYADVPAIDDGSEAAVIFCGTENQVTDIYGIKSDKKFVNTLEDNICQ